MNASPENIETTHPISPARNTFSLFLSLDKNTYAVCDVINVKRRFGLDSFEPEAGRCRISIIITKEDPRKANTVNENTTRNLLLHRYVRWLRSTRGWWGHHCRHHTRRSSETRRRWRRVSCRRIVNWDIGRWWRHAHWHSRRHCTHRHRLGYNSLLRREPRWRRGLCESTCELALIRTLETWHGRSRTKRDRCRGRSGGYREGVVLPGLCGK